MLALKTYEKKNLMKPEARDGVHAEIQILSQMAHPHIMRLFEVVDQRTHVHLVMELCLGQSLFHHTKKLHEQRLPVADCKQVFRQLMLGVGYMHSRGIAHRDLKLDNILLNADT